MKTGAPTQEESMVRVTDSSTDHSDQDHQLVQAFKAGSSAAMEKIVEKYENRVFTFGLKMCGHLQDAEDITQETFLSAFKYLEDFREETKLRNWLFKIAARACVRKRRKKKCQPDYEISLESLPQGEGVRSYDIPDWSFDPADSLLRSELKEAIGEAIQSLPPKYRLVFTLRDVEGFNTEETAQILDISPPSVKTRLHRARLFLREKISAFYREVRSQHDRPL
jgi:RNA polymerase sigma-70 factor (ECF subfamily)